jgi:hypothetical protein
MKRHHRRTIALALALAAFAAPSAFAQQDLRSPDTRDAAAPHWAAGRQVVVKLPVASEPAPGSSSSGGLDRGDAGIGGLIALAALACAGTVVLVRRAAFRTTLADGMRDWRRGVGL